MATSLIENLEVLVDFFELDLEISHLFAPPLNNVLHLVLCCIRRPKRTVM